MAGRQGTESHYKTSTLEMQKKNHSLGTSVHIEAGCLSEKANTMEVGGRGSRVTGTWKGSHAVMLLHMHKALGSTPQHPSKASTAHACNSSTQEVKAGESEVQGHSQGHRRFQAIVYNKRPHRTGQKGGEDRRRSGEGKRSPSLDA